MYKIVFEFMNVDTGGEWKKDCLDNEGEGFTKVDAFMIATDLGHRDDCRNIKIEKLEG